MSNIKLGIEVLAESNEYDYIFEDKRLALITNPTGVDRNFKSTIDILNEKYDLKALFGPEHGVRGDIPAGEIVEATVDFATGLPIYSLYRKDSQSFSEEMLDIFDVLVYDLQDVGVRFYTYPYTLLNAIEDCAKNGKTVVVLDRPNPLGGEIIEGNIIEEDYLSFVGGFPMPIRYGLTIGEFAMMAVKEKGIDVDMHVIKMQGWERDMLWPDTGLQWVSPSPNIPNFMTSLIYTGNCLTEGTNLSEGRGTTLPFKQIGAEYIKNPEKLCEELKVLKIPGASFRPVYFTPLMSKQEGKFCGGIEFYVDDIEEYRPVRTYLQVLYKIIEMYPEEFEFRSVLPPRNKSFVMLLGGNSKIYDKEPLEDIFAEYDEAEKYFLEHKKQYHLY